MHRVVVCLQSEFFHAACYHAWKVCLFVRLRFPAKCWLQESEERTIDLPEDGRDIVERMIEFFYNGDYRNFSGDQFLGHAEVFAVAIKYGVARLACLSARKYRENGQDDWDPSAFLESVPVIYSTTVDSQRGLRDAASQCARLRMRSLTATTTIYAHWRQVCLGTPAFCFEVLASYGEFPLMGRCSVCGLGQPLSSLQARCETCGKGGAYEDLEYQAVTKRLRLEDSNI